MAAQPRRKFIEQTTTAALAASFATSLGQRALAQDLDTTLLDDRRKKVGFALCGLGSLSTNQIAPALKKTRYCRLAGIVTGTPAKAEKWKAQYNIPGKN